MADEQQGRDQSKLQLNWVQRPSGYVHIADEMWCWVYEAYLDGGRKRFMMASDMPLNSSISTRSSTTYSIPPTLTDQVLLTERFGPELATKIISKFL